MFRETHGRERGTYDCVSTGRLLFHDVDADGGRHCVHVVNDVDRNGRVSGVAHV